MKKYTSVFTIVILAILFLVLTENQTIPNIASILLYLSLLFIYVIALGRYALSAYLALVTILGIYISSIFKFGITGQTLHVIDLWLHINTESLFYGFQQFPTMMAAVFVVFLIFLIPCVWLWKLEKRSTPYVALIGCLLIGGVFSWFVSYQNNLHNKGRPSMLFFRDRFHVSSLAFSMLDAADAIARGTIFDYGNATYSEADIPTLSTASVCKSEYQPNLVSVLRESTYILGDFPQTAIGGVKNVDFAALDGRVRRLRVESHGGGTWLAMFSMLTGVSTYGFGDFQTLANVLSDGRLTTTFVSELKNCGYETLVITTGKNGFAKSDALHKTLGIDRVVDIDELRSKYGVEVADEEIYEFVTSVLAERNQDQPIFIFLDTVSTHAPYNDRDRSEELLNVDLMLNNSDIPIAGIEKEYALRVATSNKQFAEFKVNLSRSQGKPVVILDFGDHQPYFTKSYFSTEGVVRVPPNMDHALVTTYYRIDGVNTPKSLYRLTDDIVDIPFLGDALLKSIGFEPSPIYAYRREMMLRCKGRYWKCDQGDAAYKLHRILRKSGAINLF
ncbi:sulfatase-like hydrolase/transferase [Pseudovibrio sp. Tun.PSC04-5.I4]|uniref:sulfatase-like hydrolase/transferase n=1 Tax=Pseudovibrio sp. Tun.PSC04-5.I4 TaxID=1798213 RepID=UPI0008807302|nr:sulfatase-like hydrolase/transferase [Pseudovibrio sp. Tun.PSC04-5.I4]SDR26047.1 Sulfatase [Pseudovibrio sp. Tun.PSC04-5.I4]